MLKALLIFKFSSVLALKLVEKDKKASEGIMFIFELNKAVLWAISTKFSQLGLGITETSLKRRVSFLLLRTIVEVNKLVFKFVIFNVFLINSALGKDFPPITTSTKLLSKSNKDIVILLLILFIISSALRIKFLFLSWAFLLLISTYRLDRYSLFLGEKEKITFLLISIIFFSLSKKNNSILLIFFKKRAALLIS